MKKPRFTDSVIMEGPEMTSDLFVSWVEEHGIELRFIQPDLS
jgi:hypothetical protein